MQKMKLILAFLVVFGCNEKPDSKSDSQEELQTFDYQKLPKKLELSGEVASILDGWEEFKALNSSIDVLYKSTNNEDLSLAIDDLLEKEKSLSDGNYPEPFNSLQIKSRQKVFRTLLLKVKASVLNKSDTTEPTIEMLQAYNIIRQQFNSILSSQLDTKLILDENQ